VNDLEARLRTLDFRNPPSELRGSVLAMVRAPGWKAWLAPHPAAWAALAALWLALATLDALLDGPSPNNAKSPLISTTMSADPPVLLALYQRTSGAEMPR